MEGAVKFIDSISNLVGTLDIFIQNNGAVVLSSLLSFGLGVYITHTVGRVWVKFIESESKQKPTKKRKEGTKNDD